MLNAGFQYLEQRDKNNNIVKAGVAGKETAFATGDNNGLYDIIAENLRWLYDNRGGGSSSETEPSSVVQGKDGESAYDIAIRRGFVGSESQWLNSLRGSKGDKGDAGVAGVDGKDGKSAYDIAKENGFTGTETDFLESLKGEPGTNGKNGTNGKPGKDGKDGINGVDGKDGLSAYEIAVKNGYNSSEVNWLESLRGKDGINGQDGKDGSNGKDGHSATLTVGTVSFSDENEFKIENVGTATDAILNIVMPSYSSIKQGKDGKDGKSVYDIAVSHGFEGTEEDYLNSLIGDKGADAYSIAVKNGFTGTEEEWLASIKGDKGDTATIKVGKVTTGTAPRVVNVGTENDAILDFTLPVSSTGGGTGTGTPGKDGRSAYEVALDNGFVGSESAWLESLKGKDGEKGADGKAATVKIGTVTEGDTPSVTNSGTDTDAVLDFVLPKGTGTGDGVPVNKTTFTFKIPATGWEDKEASLENAAIKADSVMFLGLPNDTTFDVYQQVAQACISCVYQEDGYITLRALQQAPTVDVTFEMVVF